MKFGVGIPLSPRADARHPYDHVFEYCARVEELGYDFVVLGHHRFTPGFALHPWVTLGAIAARERFRVGCRFLRTRRALGEQRSGRQFRGASRRQSCRRQFLGQPCCRWLRCPQDRGAFG